MLVFLLSFGVGVTGRPYSNFMASSVVSYATHSDVGPSRLYQPAAQLMPTTHHEPKQRFLHQAPTVLNSYRVTQGFGA